MAEENVALVDELDGATVVNDEEVAAEKAEKANADLLKNVEKILDGKPSTSTKQPQAGGDDDKAPAEDAQPQVSENLSREMQDRVKEAGLSDSLAQRLHQSGLLEESLAEFDRREIERQRRLNQDDAEDVVPEPKIPPKKRDQELPGGKEPPPPPLKAEDYDDDLVKRDAYFQKQVERIAELEAIVSRLNEMSGMMSDQRETRFQEWFAEKVVGLKNEALFGNGDVIKDSPQHKNRQTLCDGYERICEARGVDPYACDTKLLERAYPAMFRDEVFKAAQRETVDRLRNAEGKFTHASQSGSGGPPLKKQMTPEEANDKLVQEVQSILDRPAK